MIGNAVEWEEEEESEMKYLKSGPATMPSTPVQPRKLGSCFCTPMALAKARRFSLVGGFGLLGSRLTVTKIEQPCAVVGQVGVPLVTIEKQTDENSEPNENDEPSSENAIANRNKGKDKSEEHPQYTGNRFDSQKPPHSYASLIAEAILKAPEHKLSLSSIYTSIMDDYPYYRSRNSGWQNSIRHNLSLNKCFYKIERSDGEKGKGSWWTVRQEFLDKDGERAVPKQGTMMRKKRCRSKEEDVADEIVYDPPEMPINKLQIDFCVHDLFIEVQGDQSEHTELEGLCMVLCDIHANDHENFFVQDLIYRL